MYLLDTSVLSELRKLSRADANVRAWSQANRLEDFFISPVTLLELEIGVLRIERMDQPQARILRQWLEQWVITRFAGRVLDIDVSIARRCAALHVPDPRPERDALIAATALVHGLTVVTRNAADFTPMGATVLNPWLP